MYNYKKNYFALEGTSYNKICFIFAMELTKNENFESYLYEKFYSFMHTFYSYLRYGFCSGIDYRKH
ncbi:hypothetical protein GCM10007415_37390 [Parapedobacter pyrenivorans]|uniref:Uncharacterized protein n=1 Tax=Parapedobacter pyrenivorans TaxID=1305674 RepID=A0A917I012_9SPHI|nr:hypothetical protein GCM10007415_37390 [Parapedobacter pyrenivorans]